MFFHGKSKLDRSEDLNVGSLFFPLDRRRDYEDDRHGSSRSFRDSRDDRYRDSRSRDKERERRDGDRSRDTPRAEREHDRDYRSDTRRQPSRRSPNPDERVDASRGRRSEDAHPKANPKMDLDREKEQEKEDDSNDMMAAMGFAGFGSTSGQHVPGNSELGAVNVISRSSLFSVFLLLISLTLFF